MSSTTFPPLFVPRPGSHLLLPILNPAWTAAVTCRRYRTVWYDWLNDIAIVQRRPDAWLAAVRHHVAHAAGTTR